MRGIDTLYKSIFTVQPPQTGNGKRLYLDERDTALAYRYYYYAELKRFGYERTLSELEREFYLSQRAVVLRLERKTDLIKTALTNAVKLADLRGLFPYYVWN